MAYVNVAEWSPEHVSDWLKGLDDEIQPYTQFFVNNSINGCHLLTLCRDDLSNLNISKVGHQELVLEAVDLLKQLHYNLTSETLQSLALKLGCRAQSLFNHLKHVCKDQDPTKKERVSTETLAAVSDIINLVKSLISWLDRYPFLGQEKYNNVRKAVLKLSVELTSTAQRDQFAEMPHQIIKDICSNLSQQSDKIVQEFNDSLIIQPAVLEVAKIKRKIDDDVGIHINSTCMGIHVIESIKFQSPAYRCGKVEDGDEIVQVNYQTVVGWQVRNIICAMKEHPSEVHLTLKKRPRHPNVLGQVITLWPYRIPSKKTALRKLYKWNKGKAAGDINDICIKSPEIRCDMNSVPENYNIPLNDKERQLFFGRSRSKIRRRATITGISPTALQPPISLDDLIGSNSKKKQSVGRAVSYDPGKVGNVDDNVFCDGQDNDLVPKGGSKETSKSESGAGGKSEREPPAPKSQFLKPPTEKYLGSCLRRQQPVTEILPPNEVNDIKLTVDFVKPDTDSKRPSTSSINSPPTNSLSVPAKRETVSVTDSLRPKLDWLGKQKAKLEGMTNGNAAYSKTSQKSRTGSTASCPSSETTPPISRLNGNSQFPTREGRPSLSEIRALKRTAEAKLTSEKAEPLPRKNVPSLPRQNISSQKRHMQQSQNKLGCGGLKYVNAKENELNQRLNGVTMISGKKPSVHFPENCTSSEFLKYSVIPQYPFEMHKSKIVSLKQRLNSNQTRNKISYVSEPTQKPAKNGYPTKGNCVQKAPQNRAILKNAQNGKASSFNPLFGRSRSYNDIAFSSDSSSSSFDDDDEEEYDDEVYDQINDERARFTNEQSYRQNCKPPMNPNFAAKVAEVYYMLNQGHCFPAPSNSRCEQRFDPSSAAFIDQLAKSMYHALQQDHIKEQSFLPRQRNNNSIPPQKSGRSKSLSRDSLESGRKISTEENIYGKLPPNMANEKPLHSQSYNRFNHGITRNGSFETVKEKPVNLSPPSYGSNKMIPGFKSATSQEILSLYTSQVAGKSPNSSSSQYSFEKQDYPCAYQQTEKAPIYEPLSLFKANKAPYLHRPSVDHNVRIGHGNQSIMVCPAEREIESVQCNDQIISSPSDGWKYFDKGMFQPIREEPIDEENEVEEYVPLSESHLAVNTKTRTYSQSSNEVSMYFSQNGSPESSCENSAVTHKPHHRTVPPSLSLLVNSVPTPPEDDFCTKLWKCSDTQTETDNVISTDSCKTYLNDQVVSLDNDDSFCTTNSDGENCKFSRNGSLSSNGSSSTISSTNSSYYYADIHSPSQPLIKFSSSSDNSNELSMDAHRSPTMGVSMLSKKRPSQSGGSDSGCNSESHNLSTEDIPVVSIIDSGEESVSSGIITDVEHTI